MNELARQKLIDAAMRGVRQIKGALYDDHGGVCALGVLIEGKTGAIARELLEHQYGIRGILETAFLVPCPHDCGYQANEIAVIAHLNDLHGDDFLSIARKMP